MSVTPSGTALIAYDGSQLSRLAIAEAGQLLGPQSLAVEASLLWKGIVETAPERQVAVVVLGSHGRGGWMGKLTGSVAAAVAGHSQRTVLIVHHRE